MENVDNVYNTASRQLMVTHGKPVIPWEMPSVSPYGEGKLCQQKNPHFHSPKIVNENVDNVDNLFLEKMFPDLIDVSGSHGYQQIVVHAVIG